MNLNSDADQKYFMTILGDGCDSSDSERANLSKKVSCKANVFPKFNYYDSHCANMFQD